MATIAALGKTCAKPAISAALFDQDHFYTRTARFSAKFHFHDKAGNSLAFVRNASFCWNKEIRIFTDPGLSFELLTIKPLASKSSDQVFEIADSINRERVGAIAQRQMNGLAKRQWDLIDSSGLEIGDVEEDSLFRAHIRRVVTDFIPQGYKIRVAERVAGQISEKSSFSFHHLEVDISNDPERILDRRLLAGFVVLLQAASSQSRQP